MSSTLKVDILQDSGGNNLVTSNGSGVITSAGFGKVGQVVYNSITTEVGTTSSTFVTTNFSLSITPTSTSSKILILLNPHFRLYNTSAADAQSEYKIDNGTSALYTSRIRAYDYGSSGSIISINPNIVYYDSPSSTSQQTYTLFMRLLAGSGLEFCHGSRISTGTLMEILP